MSTDLNTGNRKYFVYDTAPQHITTKLIELIRIEFNSNV